ncbi:hypothetical protein ACSV9I_10605 [Rhizobium sp. G187]|uniref:hypothetical protein n=1 Tax=Rhizobium sp. G187 TaxID=3451352 RepID=UPI003EE6E2E8
MVWIAAATIAVLLAALLLKRSPLAIGVAAVIAVIGAIVWFFSDGQSRLQRAEMTAVTVSVAANNKTCATPDRPIAATFTNTSDQTVNRLSFDLLGRPLGKTDIAYRGFLRDEQVIAPGDTVTRCYALLFHAFAHPRPEIIDATKYEWSAHVTLVGFGQPPSS